MLVTTGYKFAERVNFIVCELSFREVILQKWVEDFSAIAIESETRMKSPGFQLSHQMCSKLYSMSVVSHPISTHVR